MALGDNLAEDVLVIGGTAAIGFFVFKKITNFLGFSDEEKQKVEEQQALPPEQNAFNPGFQDLQNDFDNDNPNGRDNAGNLVHYDLNSYMAIANQLYAGNNFIPEDFATAYANGGSTGSDYINNVVAVSELIMGGFGFLTTDKDPVVYAFSLFATKLDVAYVSAYLRVNHNYDLLDLLSDGSNWTITGISGTAVVDLINKVNSLPDNY